MAQARRTGSRREHPPIGERLRESRQERGLSLRDLAERLGVSPSLISQIETGRARPSVNTLYAIADELGMSLDDLLFIDPDRGGSTGQPSDASTHDGWAGDQARPGPVQRADNRKLIRLASGVVWERLTTSSEVDVEFLKVTYEVGGASSPESEFQRHGGHEWGFVLSGQLGVTIGFDEYQLGPGDSVSLDSTAPHRLFNRGTEPVEAIWFVLGRHSVQLDRDAVHSRTRRRHPPRSDAPD